MKVTLESTDTITTITIGGREVPARIWQGETEQGVACHAYITRIACHKDLDNGEFERALREEPHTRIRSDLQGYDLRLFLP